MVTAPALSIAASPDIATAVGLLEALPTKKLVDAKSAILPTVTAPVAMVTAPALSIAASPPIATAAGAPDPCPTTIRPALKPEREFISSAVAVTSVFPSLSPFVPVPCSLTWTTPESIGLALGALVPNAVVTVIEKDASSSRAAANSFSVSSVPGAEATKSATAVETNAVVASWVELAAAVVLSTVGAVGTPVNAGLSSGALRLSLRLSSALVETLFLKRSVSDTSDNLK